LLCKKSSISKKAVLRAALKARIAATVIKGIAASVMSTANRKSG